VYTSTADVTPRTSVSASFSFTPSTAYIGGSGGHLAVARTGDKLPAGVRGLANLVP
jgi:hypothetical protein